MLLVQKWPFFQLYFSANIGQKKTRSSKSHKIDIFPKRLAHAFGPKPAILQLSFLGNFSQENIFNDILERVNAFLGFKRKKFKKSKNSHFSKGVNPQFWSKNGYFSNFFFPAIQARKMFLTIFQNKKKTPFQAIKTRSSKSHKIDIFAKGLTHAFGPKIAIFPGLFFRQYRLGKCLLRYSRTKKKPFQAIKTRRLKSHKIDIFPKGLTPAFGPKMAIFPTFFFPQYRPGKSLLRYSRPEKTPFQAIRTGSSKSHKIDIFPKGLTHACNQKIAIFPIFFLDNIGQENVFYDILERKKTFIGYKNTKFKKS